MGHNHKGGNRYFQKGEKGAKLLETEYFMNYSNVFEQYASTKYYQMPL